MTVPVQWLSFDPAAPARGYWDQTILEDLFAGRFFRPEAFAVEHVDRDVQLPTSATPILVVPGSSHASGAPREQLRAYLDRFDTRVLLVISSDEGSLLDPRELASDRVRVWVQNGRRAYCTRGIRSFPTGYTPPTRDVRDAWRGQKELDWFFAGQITHARRRSCIAALRTLPGGEIVETDGFSRGLPPRDYLNKLASARIAPCPGGAVTPDTFRVYEALELGCVPIIDRFAGAGKDATGYWQTLFGSSPLPFVDDWNQAPEIVRHLLSNDLACQQIAAWWLEYKRYLARDLRRDVAWLTGRSYTSEGQRLSIVVPTSPIATHPDTGVIDTTLESVTKRPDLDGAEILVMCDGVRKQQTHYAAAYAAYRTELLREARLSDRAIVRIFETHHHQAAMLRNMLGDVDRPAILFLEHDAPLTGEIPFEKLVAAVCAEVSLIRLHHETLVLEVHAHLMLDNASREVEGLPLRRTVQWSQRPHVANTGFYRRVLNDHFAADERFMIEDRMHSVVETAWRQYGIAGWEKFRLYMYVPAGNIQRSLHTNGRGSDPKWVDE
jgi:hypothetical protein